MKYEHNWKKIDDIPHLPRKKNQQPNVFLRLITKVQQSCLRVENKR